VLKAAFIAAGAEDLAPSARLPRGAAARCGDRRRDPAVHMVIWAIECPATSFGVATSAIWIVEASRNSPKGIGPDRGSRPRHVILREAGYNRGRQPSVAAMPSIKLRDGGQRSWGSVTRRAAGQHREGPLLHRLIVSGRPRLVRGHNHRWREATSEAIDMLEVGMIVDARVYRTEPYGVFLRHGDDELFVHLPELSWTVGGPANTRRLEATIQRVKILRRDPKINQWHASVRRAHPESNPFVEIARLPAGTVLDGVVFSARPFGLAICVRDGALGRIEESDLTRSMRVGDIVRVRVGAIDPEEGKLQLNLA
jgi:hypothetical protein